MSQGFRAFVRAWNQASGQSTPRHHRNIAAWLERRLQRNDRRLLLLVFRGAGKSTLIGLFCAWLLLGAPATRILVLAAEEKLARRMVQHVRRIVERHPWWDAAPAAAGARWAAAEFTLAHDQTLRDPSMLARGVRGNITGSRADLIVFDDVEAPNTAGHAAARAALRERLKEAEFVAVPGAAQVYIGTPHAADTIYNAGAEGELAHYAVLRATVLDAKGRSRWPALWSAERLARQRRRVGEAAFAMQMMLDPGAGAEPPRLEARLLRRYSWELELREAGGERSLWLGPRRLVQAAAAWDPALGGPQRDGSVLAALFFDAEGNAHLHRLAWIEPVAEHLAGPVADQAVRAAADLMQTLHLPGIVVESNGVGALLPALLRQELARRALPAQVATSISRRAKRDRIIGAWEPALQAGRLWAHESVFATPLPRELADWSYGGAGHDDGLDAVAMALEGQAWRLGPRAPPRPTTRPDWRPGIAPVTAPHAFKP